MPDLKTELSKLKTTPFEAEGRKTKHHESSEPIFTKMLAEKLGNNAEASRLLGYSTGMLSTAFERGRVSTVAEVAARGILERMEAKERGAQAVILELPSESTEVALVDRYLAGRVPADKVDAFKAVCTAMGVNMKELD